MVTVFCGPMFAGKTTALIAEYFSKTMEGHNTVFLKPKFDDRYSVSSVVSHDKETTPCQNISTPEDLIQYGQIYDYIFIDEIQFLEDDEYFKQIRNLMMQNKNLYLAGLDMDSFGIPMTTTAWCLALADKVHKLSALCECGERATMTRRRKVYGDKFCLGGEELYEAVCRSCYNKKSILR